MQPPEYSLLFQEMRPPAHALLFCTTLEGYSYAHRQNLPTDPSLPNPVWAF